MNVTPKPEIPNKLYFKIGEVARIVAVEPYVLRYWESEFHIVRPGKTRSNHRLYRRRDIEALLEIKRLLHAERYTIEGARKRLKGPSKGAAERKQMALPLSENAYRETLTRVKDELRAIARLLG